MASCRRRAAVASDRRADPPHHAVAYRANDVLVVGRGSSGVPHLVHAANPRVRVAMAPGRRSLNVVTALAIVLGAALRQTGGFAERICRDNCTARKTLQPAGGFVV